MSKPVRILHIFGRLAHGGAELRTLDVIRNADARRYEFDFVSLTGQPGPLDDTARQMGCRVHLLPLRSGFGRRFRALLRERSISIVQSHVHHASGYILRQAHLAGVPGRVCHYRSSGDQQRVGLLRRLQQKSLKQLVHWHATHIVGVSQSTLTAAWSPRWQQDRRCQVIYNGLDLQSFTVPAPSLTVHAEFSLKETDRLAIHVGRFNPAKNHTKLIGIFQELHCRDPRWKLLLVGGGAEEEIARIRQLVLDAGLSTAVLFAGLRNDLPRLLRAAELKLFPSLYEGLPGAVLEAVVTGLPVLGSRLATIEEVAQHFSVIRTAGVDAPNTEWADAAERLLHDSNSRNRDSALQSFRASAFTIEECVERHACLWDDAAGVGRTSLRSAA